jgi:Flp pilus assembly protein TadD
LLSLAFACARIPKAADSVTMLRLVLRGEKKDKAQGDPYSFSLGAVLCRCGRYDDALRALLAAQKARREPSSLDSLFLALVYHGLGKKDEARTALQRAAGLIEEEEKNKTLRWQQRVVRKALRQEVTELLK